MNLTIRCRLLFATMAMLGSLLWGNNVNGVEQPNFTGKFAYAIFNLTGIKSWRCVKIDDKQNLLIRTKCKCEKNQPGNNTGYHEAACIKHGGTNDDAIYIFGRLDECKGFDSYMNTD